MAGTSGSHTGSFAGGFIKSFLAVMQMAMRRRQMEDAHMLYLMSMRQMQFNMDRQTRLDNIGEGGRQEVRDRLENFGSNETEGKLKVSDMTDMAKKAGFKGADAAHMGAIAAAESGGDQSAVGKADEVGITQINPHTWPELAQLAKQGPQQAMDAAFQVYTKTNNSFSPWSTDPSSPNFTPKNSMEKFLGTARKAAGLDGQRVSAIDTRDSGEAKSFLSSVSNHADRAGDTSNMNSEFATRLADAIKQANAEGIPARLESGYRDPDELWNRGDRSKAAYFDAEGLSKHSDGRAGDIAGIGTAGSDTAQRWAEIANSKGLSVPYGYDNPKEFNHTELAGLTPLRGAQPVNAAGNMVAGPGARGGPAPLPESSIKRVPTTTPYIPPANAPDQGTPNLGGGITQPQLPPSSVPAAPAAPTAPAAPVASAAQPAAIPTRTQQPDYRYGMPAGGRGGGQYQYVVPAGPQPQLAQPVQPIPQQAPSQQAPPQQAPQPAAIPDRTDALASAPMPPPDPRQGQRPQQVPLGDTPLPPPRPADLTGETDTSGDFSPANMPSMNAQNVINTGGAGGSSADPLWAGYVGASPDEAASADPLANLYSSSQDFSASAGLTDTSGMMAAGMMADMANANEPDVTAEMYRGGPVIRYQRGGVIRRYAAGGDTEDGDLLADYGGTDTDDPSATAYGDVYRASMLTNNSDPSAEPDIPTSIMNRTASASPQDEEAIKPPSDIPSSLSDIDIAPQSAAQPSTEQPSTEQPAAAPTEQPTGTPTETPTEQPTGKTTGQSDIPPGSVQVAGPGGWNSLVNIPLPRVGGSMGGMGGVGMRRPSLSTLMGGSHRLVGVGKSKDQELYTPSYIAKDDYNHLGVAPTNNADGTPSVWLLNMVDNGVRALFTGFGFANRGAIPGSPEQSQNLDAYLKSNGIDSQDMHAIRETFDPKHKFIEGAAEIGGAVSMIKHYALTGNLDAASRLAGGVLLYTRMMSMQYGDEAVKALFKGDYKEAVGFLEKSHGWVPDGKSASGEIIDKETGKVRAQLKDGNGNVLDQRDYMPAAIMEAALGAQSGKSYWAMLSGIAQAGGNDVLGAHYETQRMLREIKGNQGVAPPPLAAAAAPKTPIESPDGATPPAPDNGPTPVVAPPDSTQSGPPDSVAPDPAIQSDPDLRVGAPPTPTAPNGPTVQAAPPAAPPPTAIPSQGAGGMHTGMAVPVQPLTQPQPQTAMASRGDTSNLVAGPAAPSTTQAQPAQPAQPSDSGNVLIAQSKARAEQAQQSQAISRMVNQGMYDPDDPYVQQKINEIKQKYLGSLQPYRDKIIQQYADLEASGATPADKKMLKAALDVKLKAFDNDYTKPRADAAKQEFGQIAARLKEQFSIQKAIALQKQAEINKQQDQARAYDNQRVGAEQKRQAALPAGHPQLNADAGTEADGSPMINKFDGKRILGYGEQLEGNLTDKDPDNANAYANPITRYALRGNPWLSSSTTIDPKTNMVDPASFDPSKLPDFTPTDRRTMAMASRDIIMYNSGDVDFREAQDITSGVATGAYIVSRPQDHPPIHSRVLGDLPNDDGVPRSDIYIRRGINDQNPIKVTMSTANATRLVNLAEKADKISVHNRAMASIHAPAGPSYPSAPSWKPPRPAIPAGPTYPYAPSAMMGSGAAKSDIALPPRAVPTPITPNAPPQPDYTIPENEPTVMDWFRSHTKVAPPAANPFR